LWIQLGVALLCLFALRRQWSSVEDFVAAIDHGNVPFGDFVFHYYPTAKDSIRQGAPAGGFFYPAGFAVLLAPLGCIDVESARLVWLVILLVAALWTATWLVQATTPKQPALSLVGTALVMTSTSLLHNF